MSTHEQQANSPDQIEVMQGAWRPLSEGGILYTVGISTCVGVSIYDKTKRMALLGHFDAPSIRQGSADQMLEAAQKYISNLPDAHIWLGGGALLDPETEVSRNPDYTHHHVELANEETEHFRQLVVEKVEGVVGKGVSLSPFWLRGAVYIDYALDVATGEEHVTAAAD